MSATFWNGTFTVFQALEKILVVIGVPIAAYWTFYTFSMTETEKARISYEVRLARAKNQGLQIQIDCATHVIGRKRFVVGEVDVFNMGAALVSIHVSGKDVVAVSRLAFDRDGAPRLTRVIAMPFLTDNARPGQAQAFVAQRRRFLPFAFSPTQDGVYFIRFNAPVSFSNEDGSFTPPLPWGASSTVVVDGAGKARCGSSSPA